MLDYLRWRGDLSMTQAPFCDVDALILASFCYNELPRAAADPAGIRISELIARQNINPGQAGNQYKAQWRALMQAMAASERFGGLYVHDFTDEIDPGAAKQFSAVCVSLSDSTEVAAFRGTDTSLTGWHEDFNMSFETVPAQLEAVAYLAKLAASRPNARLILTGHSKGGNLAAFAAVHSRPEIRERILMVYSFDGPGLDEAAIQSDAYRELAPRVRSVIPQSSVVGLLMGYHPVYTVVRSTSVSLWQHDAFKWQLDGPRFDTVRDLHLSSEIMNDALHAFLEESSPRDRREFVSAVFQVLEATGASTLSELTSSGIRSAAALVSATASMEEQQRKLMFDIFTRMMRIGIDAAQQKVLSAVPERLKDIGEMIRTGAQAIQQELTAALPDERKGGKAHE